MKHIRNNNFNCNSFGPYTKAPQTYNFPIHFIQMLLLLPFCSYMELHIFNKFFYKNSLFTGFKNLKAYINQFFPDNMARIVLYMNLLISLFIIIYLLNKKLDYLNNNEVKKLSGLIMKDGCFIIAFIFATLLQKHGLTSLILFEVSSLTFSYTLQKYMKLLFDKSKAISSPNLLIMFIGVITYGILLVKLF